MSKPKILKASPLDRQKSISASIQENGEAAGSRFRDVTPEQTMSGHYFVFYPLAFNITVISQNSEILS